MARRHKNRKKFAASGPAIHGGDDPTSVSESSVSESDPDPSDD